MEKPEIGKWVLTPHAVQRLAERQITVLEIEQVIRFPDLVLAQGPKFILAKNLKNRSDNLIACVVLEKKSHDLWVVITVMHNFEET